MKAFQLFISFIFFSVYLFGQKPTVKDPSYFYRGAIMGGAFIIISIPLQIGFTKNMRKATDIYNSGLNLAYNHNDFNLQITSNGFGLVFRL